MDWIQSLGWLKYVASAIGGAILVGVGREVGKWAVDGVRKCIGVGKRAGRVDLSGRWYAAWQTTVGREQNLNTELIKITQRGTRVVLENLESSPENPHGGYLWQAQCRLYDNEQLLGHYLPKSKNVTAKGVFYFVVSHRGDLMTGGWVGCNMDYELTAGHGVIAPKKEDALSVLKKRISHKSGVLKQEGESP